MKIYKYSITILLITFLLLTFSACYSTVSATSIGNVMSGADGFIKNGQGTQQISGDDLKSLSDTIYNVLLIIGIAIAMIIGVVLGIQFITGSVEAKSKVKESLIPYFAGCIVIFGAFGIWKLVVTIFGGLAQ